MPNPEQYPGYGVEELDQQLEKTLSWLSRNVSTASGNPLAYVKPGHEPSIFKPRTVVGDEGAPMAITKGVGLSKALQGLIKKIKYSSGPFTLKGGAKTYTELLKIPKEHYKDVKAVKYRDLNYNTFGEYSPKKRVIKIDAQQIGMNPLTISNTPRHEFTHARQYTKAVSDPTSDYRFIVDISHELGDSVPYRLNPVEMHAWTTEAAKGDLAERADEVARIIVEGIQDSVYRSSKAGWRKQEDILSRLRVLDLPEINSYLEDVYLKELK